MINYTTVPEKIAPYVSPFPSQAFGDAILMKQGQYDEGARKLQQSIDYLDSLPALTGPDAQKKQEILQSVPDMIKQLAGQDLSDPNVRGQVDSFISKVGNDPDLVAIVGRAVDYKNKLAKKEKITANGETINPEDEIPLTAYSKYMSGNSYIRHFQPQGDVYKATPWDKVTNDMAKDVETQGVKEGWIDKDWWTKESSIKERNANTIKQAVQSRILGDPTYHGALDRMVQSDLDGQDILKYYQDNATQGLASNKAIIEASQNELVANEYATKTYGKGILTDEEVKDAKQALVTAQSQQATYSAYLDPNFNEFAAKEHYKKEKLDKITKGAVETHTLLEHETKTDISKIKEMDHRFAQEKVLKQMDISARMDAIKLQAEETRKTQEVKRTKADAGMNKDIHEMLTTDKFNASPPTGTTAYKSGPNAKQPVNLTPSLATKAFPIPVELEETGYHMVQGKDATTGKPAYDDNGDPLMVSQAFSGKTTKIMKVAPTGAYKKNGVLYLEFKVGNTTYERAVQDVVDTGEETTTTTTTTTKNSTTTPTVTPTTTTTDSTGKHKPVVSMK